MASANRLQMSSVEEVTLGTTPVTPRMRNRRITSHALKFTPTFVDSEERRPDGMESDPILTGTDSNGPINFEFHYPFPGSPMDSDIKSALRNTWTNTPSRDNDGTADSVITDIGTTTDTVACTTGPAFVAGHLVRFSGNTNSANDGVRKCTTGSATAPVFATSGFVADAAPSATSRMKVVGFVGASGDITATATGLASTALNFTTLGILVGGFGKIGGSAAGDKFATAALNVRVRVIAVTANAITLDNLPSGWATDAGTGKTIKFWFGDQIINGVTTLGQSIERGYLGQTAPTYIAQAGMVVNQYTQTFEKKMPMKGTVTYMGMGATQSQVTLDAVPDAALSNITYPVFSCSSNLGRVGEAGASLAGPNFPTSFSFAIDWHSTTIDTVTDLGPQGITQHSCTITGKTELVFGDNTFLTKFFNGTASNGSLWATKGVQAFSWQFPRLTYNGDGAPSDAKNTEDMLPLSWKASKDTALTNAMILLNRLEYVE
jgi:hypothetical protein